jgi:hypothetical protein
MFTNFSEGDSQPTTFLFVVCYALVIRYRRMKIPSTSRVVLWGAVFAILPTRNLIARTAPVVKVQHH